MRNIGGIVVVLAFIISISSGTAGLYYFTQMETQRSELEALKAEVKKLRSGGSNKASRENPAPTAGAVPVSDETKAPVDGSPGADGAVSPNGMVIINTPSPDQSIGSPAAVTGRAIAFESTVVVRVADSSGQVLAEVPVTTNAPDTGRFGDFAVDVSFAKSATATGTVEVFEYSAKDGQEINKAGVPVRFAP